MAKNRLFRTLRTGNLEFRFETLETEFNLDLRLYGFFRSSFTDGEAVTFIRTYYDFWHFHALTQVTHRDVAISAND